jgi:hypothetical protein
MFTGLLLSGPPDNASYLRIRGAVHTHDGLLAELPGERLKGETESIR